MKNSDIQKKLFNLKNNNFQEYLTYMQFIIHDITQEYVKRPLEMMSNNSEQILNQFKIKLKKDIELLRKLPGAGVNENLAADQLLAALNP
jgi:hypothetical protein